jgi:hypothetical protein
MLVLSLLFNVLFIFTAQQPIIKDWGTIKKDLKNLNEEISSKKTWVNTGLKTKNPQLYTENNVWRVNTDGEIEKNIPIVTMCPCMPLSDRLSFIAEILNAVKEVLDSASPINIVSLGSSSLKQELLTGVALRESGFTKQRFQLIDLIYKDKKTLQELFAKVDQQITETIQQRNEENAQQVDAQLYSLKEKSKAYIEGALYEWNAREFVDFFKHNPLFNAQVETHFYPHQQFLTPSIEKKKIPSPDILMMVDPGHGTIPTKDPLLSAEYPSEANSISFAVAQQGRPPKHIALMIIPFSQMPPVLFIKSESASAISVQMMITDFYDLVRGNQKEQRKIFNHFWSELHGSELDNENVQDINIEGYIPLSEKRKNQITDLVEKMRANDIQAELGLEPHAAFYDLVKMVVNTMPARQHDIIAARLFHTSQYQKKPVIHVVTAAEYLALPYDEIIDPLVKDLKWTSYVLYKE